MKDIFKKYKKQKKVSAIWINFLIIDGSGFGNSMKANILEVKTQNQQSDIYAKLNNNIVDIFSNQNIDSVKNVSMSLSYNPDNVGILLQEDKKSEIIRLSDDKWIQSLLINYSPEKNIATWEKIFSIETSKLNQKSEQLNIFNANFTDTSWDNYLLSTSGITF